MELSLDREDLHPDHKGVSCSQTKFEHFKPAAQEAIRVVGRAVYYTDKGTRMENYNAIYPPKQ